MKSKVRSNCKTLWRCPHCVKAFKYESEMRRHEQSHVPQFECNICNKKFSFLSALRRHEKQHERTGSVQCNKCGGNFRDETLLKRHIQYAHKGSYVCNKCSTIFSSESALKTHMLTHKPESERKYHCSFTDCGKTFNFPHHLKHHELTHTDSKQFFCKVCGKGFIQSHHLKIHQKTHEPDSWLPCTVPECKKKFINEYARKRHLVTHKSRVDSGISSDSNAGGDIDAPLPISLLEDLTLCRCCGKLISTILYSNHISKCSVHQEEVSKEFKTLLHIEKYDKTVDEPVHENVVKIDIDDKVSTLKTCETVLGGCIVSEGSEGNDDCLCAQMSTVVEYCDLVAPIDNEDGLTDNIKNIPLSPIDNIEDNKICDGCKCSTVCRSESQNRNEIPCIEYRTDGTIKINETFDMDVVTDFKTIKEPDVKENIKDLKSVMFNSCKDVLGNCIVSGNSTMGEGCLCAKMSMDDQQMIAQEIEDITPCPQSMWLNSSVI